MAQGLSPQKYDRLYSLSNRGEYGTLIQHLRDHDDENVRFGASGVLAESVEEFKEAVTPEAQEVLVDSVLNDPSDAVRANVISILLEIDESTLDTVVTRLQAEPEATPTGTPYPLILTKWHSKPKPELRYLAVVGFERVGSASAAQKLRTTIKRENNMRVLKRAIKAGGKIGDETFVTPIQEQLRVEDAQYDSSVNEEQIREVKEAAVQALVRIGSNAAYEALLTASRGTDEQLKEQVLSEIGKFGAEDTVDVIVRELDNDENDELRKEAAEGVITTFRESEFDEGDSIRQQTIDKISEEVSIDVSTEFASIVAESPRKSEKRNAAWMLGQLESTSDETVESLLTALQDDDANLRQIATASLTKLDPTEIEPKIDAFIDEIDSESEAYQLASFIKSNLKDEAEEAKKELVDYSYVASPSDYTTDRE